MKTKIYSLIISFAFSCMYLSGQVLCPAPTTLTVANITAASATLSWSGTSTVSSYKISYQASTPANAPILFVNTNTSTATLANLTANTTYMAKVQKVCESNGVVVYSNPAVATFTTLAGTTNPCAVPIELLAKEITATSAKLFWNAVSGASSYNVMYKVANSSVAYTTVNTTVNYLIRTNLSPATLYEFKVQTVCGGSNAGLVITSAYSSVKTFSTLSGTTHPCAVPVDLLAKEITANSARLTWNPVSGAKSYNVVYKSTKSTTSTTVNTLTNYLNLSGLNPATNYEFKVQTVCGESGTNTLITSAFSAIKPFVTLGGSHPEPCAVPTEISAKAITSNSAKIMWNPVSGAIAYKVIFKATITPDKHFTSVNTSTNYVILNNLTPGTIYQYQVQTVCAGASGTNKEITSALSALKTFTTLGGTPNPCPAPTNLSSTIHSFSHVTLGWNSSNKMGFNVKYKPLNSLNWTTTFWTVNSKTIGNLLPNTNYEWKVQSVCSTTTNNGLFSEWVGSKFKTPPQLILGPNPSGSNLKLYYQSGSSQQISCTIHDYYGKVVILQNKDVVEGSNEIEIATDAVENGIYFVQVKGSEGTQLMKFLIQH
ncbi:MAG: fibronectin type III domain-containing protein [Bacteroidota bacterium]|nr:fibronectin type III domain-containing protein [Bacteroidota bacterium]